MTNSGNAHIDCYPNTNNSISNNKKYPSTKGLSETQDILEWESLQNGKVI